ncbi:MAG: pilus assembly FimT family protein [Planctomycetota bacterium]|jgi:type II secretory pathway pseudopilin PulG
MSDEPVTGAIMRRLRRQGSGFTLIDLLLAITILVLAAAVVLPEFSNDAHIRLMAASRVLTSDIELAQVMTISDPEQPVVVRFEPANAKYWLAYADTPDTAIQLPGGAEPYEIVLGEGRARGAVGVSISLVDIDGDILAFNPQGGIEDLTAQPQITLGLGSRWIRLTLASTTGTITETAGSS